MQRRNFLKSIIAAVACAAIPMGMKKPLSMACEESIYEEMLRNQALAHIEGIERAYLFGTSSVETQFGTVTYKTHPLFT